MTERISSAPSPHRLTLEGRGTLILTGVEDVKRFDEEEIIMTTSEGELYVRGSELHIEALSLDGGEMRITGKIDSLSYEELRAGGGGFFSRLMGG